MTGKAHRARAVAQEGFGHTGADEPIGHHHAKHFAALVEILAGDVVWFAAGERHWHGAAPDATMTHIAVHAALNGSTVDWDGPVADADYLAAPEPSGS